MNTAGPNDDAAQEEKAVELHTLPNGMVVHHANKHETEFLYREIFLEKVYLRNGINLGAGACVFDIGANIGIFTLFVKQACPDARVFAFEPIPSMHRLLSLNVARFGPSVHAYQKGVAAKEGEEATLIYYPGYTIMSGFHADVSADAGVLSSSMRKQIENGSIRRRPQSDEHILEMAKHTLRQKTEIKCQMTTISHVIRASGVKKIDLLKIDAEKSELEILKGIDEADWPKIGQIVLEAHSAESAEIITSKLAEKGFKTIVEQEDQLVNSGVCNCFAIRH